VTTLHIILDNDYQVQWHSLLQMRSRSNVVSLLGNRYMQEATTCEELQRYVMKRRWRAIYAQKGNTKYIISFSYIARSYIYIKTLVTLTNAQFSNSWILSLSPYILRQCRHLQGSYTKFSIKHIAINRLQKRYICCDVNSAGFG